ncbi:MAG: ABC transporter permease [Pseudomonadales bacterium]|nr:ABC transporter permease [Pseudomonadales bacterium]
MHNISSHFLILALQSLLRNRVQTGLAMMGVTVGVSALVTSISLGRGAREAIQDQLLAAGVNMIIVTAGNYQVEQGSGGDGVEADHGSISDPRLKGLLNALQITRMNAQSGGYISAVHEPRQSFLQATNYTSVARPGQFLNVHFEDDPFAVHDHPTASQRLGDSMAGLGAAATLTIEDARAIETRIPGVQYTASGVHENARIKVNDENGRQWFTRLHGTEENLPRIRSGWHFPSGEFLTRRQLESAEQVMVLGRVVADKLFGEGVDPVGKTVSLWNQPFEITGIVDSKGWATHPAIGDDQFDAIYVPVTTVHRLLNLSKLNTITITSKSAGDTTRIAGEIVDLLRQRHGITDMMADDFTVKTQAAQLLGKGLSPELARVVAGNMESVDDLTIDKLSQSLERANRTMMILLAGIAGVSLLVGGIGVMNLLLLSVTQRTREVGLRIAMGARSRDIATQFIIEAISLCLIGGLIGAVLGIFIASGIEQFFQWSTDISILSTVVAIAVAILLGILSGVYPAQRAARLDPIGALHAE